MRHPILCHYSTAPAKCICFPLLSACRRGSQLCIPRYPAGHVVHSTRLSAHIILELDAAFSYFCFLATLSCKHDPTRATFTFASSFFGIFLFSHCFQFAFTRAMDIYATIMHSHFLGTRYLFIYLHPRVGLAVKAAVGL